MTEKIDKDELTDVVIHVDDLRVLTGDIMSDFFDLFDPEKEENKQDILYSFSRARALSQAVFTLLYDVEQELNKLGIKR